MWRKRYTKSSLKNADTLDCCGLYVPNNHQITEEEIKTICEIVNESIK